MPCWGALYGRRTSKLLFEAFWQDCGDQGHTREVVFVRELGSMDLDDDFETAMSQPIRGLLISDREFILDLRSHDT
jgi:hypothetical protein